MATPATLEQQEITRIANTTAVDYVVSILELAPVGGAFHVHKNIVRRKSAMIAAWIDNRPDQNTFSFAATTDVAVAVFVLWTYNSTKIPTLDDVARQWPEFATKGTYGNPLPQGPEYEWKQFLARLDAYSLGTRYVIHGLKGALSDPLFEYYRTAICAHSDKGKDIVSAIFAKTDADDTNVRSRIVAYAAVNKPWLDTSPQGRAIISLMEVYVPWTWCTSLRVLSEREKQAVVGQPPVVAPAPTPTPAPNAIAHGLAYGPQQLYQGQG